MHGIIHAELKSFVIAALGADGWNQIAAEAGVANATYLPGRTYPDEDVTAIVAGASKRSGQPSADLLEAFGRFLVPTLVSVYKPFIRSQWRTLDLIANTENTIHKAVRLRNPGAAPPMLQVERTAPDEVRIHYTSPRRMCAVARGIAAGVATHYEERVDITEPKCMLRGDDECLIGVRRAS